MNLVNPVKELRLAPSKTPVGLDSLEDTLRFGFFRSGCWPTTEGGGERDLLTRVNGRTSRGERSKMGHIPNGTNAITKESYLCLSIQKIGCAGLSPELNRGGISKSGGFCNYFDRPEPRANFLGQATVPFMKPTRMKLVLKELEKILL